MVDEENVEVPATTSSAEPAPTVAKEPPAAPRPKKSRGLAWMGYFILLAVIGLSVGGWYLLQELRNRQEGLGGQLSSKDQQLQDALRRLNELQSEFTALHSQVASAQSQVSTEDSKVERVLSEQAARLNDRIDLTRAELGGAVQNIQRQLNRTRGDLLVADAEYLLSIANQKLQLVGDVKAVLAAMEAADQRLHDSGDPAVFKVREALAEEIATVKKLEAPDVVGISSQLLNLEKRAKTAPLFLPHAGVVKEHAEKPASSPIDTLKGLVTVRRADRPIEEILEPQQAEALRQIFLLKLETTRAALLRGDQTLYQASLSSALDWLKENFDPEAQDTKDIQAELNTLLSQNLGVSFPDISKSLNLLRNIERLRLEAEQGAPKKNVEEPKPKVPAPTEPPPAEEAPDGAPL